VIVAIEPQMYQEVLAFEIRKQRPQSEVILISPQTLEDEAKRMKPHLIIANEVPLELKEKSFWMELSVEDGLDAIIRADGYSTTIHDITIEDLLGVVDKAEEELVNESE
jgi:hypothetical protein